MTRYEFLKQVGSMQQVASVRPMVCAEGRAKNMKIYEVKNGPLRFQVLADKCLDLGECSYKGINLSFLAKPGLTGRMDYDTHGEEGVKSLMGGLLFTCGLENTCLPCTVDGRYYPMHGRLRSTPGEQVSAVSEWQDDGYKMQVSGTMREASLFGNNMTLTRKIETIYGEKSIYLTDVIENVSYQPQPMMVLYHFNLGYPLLAPGSRVVVPSIKVTPRDKAAQKGFDQWNVMEAPAENEAERVYLHELAADGQGNTSVALLNDELELGIQISFNKKYLPRFVQWKSPAAGDYVMGMEPTNSGVYGRSEEGAKVHRIEPFEKETIQICITVLDGSAEIRKVEEEIHKLC